jgi:hypothetical protein
MSKFTVKPGSKVTIGVRGDADQQLEKTGPRYIGVETGDEQYIFRRGAIQFFDLGTRLRSVPPGTTFDRLRVRTVGELSVPEQHDSWFNEYVEMALDIARDINDHDVSGGEAASHTVELLGSLGGSDPMSPLETSAANVSGRKLPHCMPLPYHAEWLWVDAVLYNDGGERRYVVGADEKRPFVNSTFDGPLSSEGRWKKTAAALNEENWNPLNDIIGDGELRASFRGKKLRIDSAAFYESFDTGDTSRFKWTQGSSFGSPEVAVPALGGKLVRVFLVPRIEHIGVGCSTVMNNGAISSLSNPSCSTRLAVYPSIGELHWVGTLGNGRRNYWVTRGFARAMSASIERSPKFIESRIPQDLLVLAANGATSIVARRNGIFILRWFNTYARTGQLVGIVEISGDPYFGWLKADDTNHGQKINSLSAPVDTQFNPQASMPHNDWKLTPMFLYTGADGSTAAAENVSADFQVPIL